MAEIDVELGNELVEGMKHLALRHYGDAGEASIARVAEAALQMRLQWLQLVEEGGNDVDEPSTSWELASEGPVEQTIAEIRSWLFRR